MVCVCVCVCFAQTAEQESEGDERQTESARAATPSRQEGQSNRLGEPIESKVNMTFHHPIWTQVAHHYKLRATSAATTAQQQYKS
jgi:hypothetical protein